MIYGLRPAGWPDRFVLWQWRNDPASRQAERSDRLVPWLHYKDWLRQGLDDPLSRLVLAEAAADVLAFGRLTLVSGNTASIGINLNPRYRGRRLAARFIEDAIAHARSSLAFTQVRALIRAENTPSRRAFARAGFHETETKYGICTYLRRLS